MEKMWRKSRSNTRNGVINGYVLFERKLNTPPDIHRPAVICSVSLKTSRFLNGDFIDEIRPLSLQNGEFTSKTGAQRGEWHGTRWGTSEEGKSDTGTPGKTGRGPAVAFFSLIGLIDRIERWTSGSGPATEDGPASMRATKPSKRAAVWNGNKRRKERKKQVPRGRPTKLASPRWAVHVETVVIGWD